MDLGLKGKVAVVTGGTKGIGRGCCEALANEGANLVINYRSDPDGAENVAQFIREKYGVEVLLVCGDASKEETVDKIFDKAMEKYGTVDIVVNNAGAGFAKKDFENLTYEDWISGQDNNLNGQFLMCHKYVKYWKGLGRCGHIVNIISKACLMTNSINNQIYCSAKGGLMTLTRTLAHEVTKYGIYVNCVAPGYVQTERLYQPGSPEYERKKQFLKTGEYAKPRDIGNVVTFLCSRQARQIIGAVVDCTGGMLL